MARPRYILEDEEKQREALAQATRSQKETQTIALHSDAGAAAKPQSTAKTNAAGGRVLPFIYEEKTVDLDRLSQKRAVSMASVMKTGQERMDFLSAYREHISDKKSTNYRKNAPTTDALMKEAQTLRDAATQRVDAAAQAQEVRQALASRTPSRQEEEEKGWFARQMEKLAGVFASQETQEETPQKKTQTAQEAESEQEDVQPPEALQTIGENMEKAQDAETGMTFTGRKSGSVDLAQDLGAAIRYVQSGRMDELTAQTQEALDRVMDIPGAKEWLGMLGDDEFDQFAYTNADGTTGAEKNNIGAEYLYLISRGRLGSLGKVAAQIADEDFPQDIREDAMMAGLQLLDEVDQWKESGAFVREVESTYGEGTAEDVNVYEEYIRLHGRESDSLRALSLAMEYAQERKEQEKEAQRLAAEQEERNRAQQLEDARNAVLGGSYTAEQMRLVMENAPDMSGEARMQDSLYARLRAQMDEEWDYSESEWMDAQVLDMAAAAYGDDTLNANMEWMYRTVAQSFLQEALDNRIDAAYALGYESLEEYAATHGEMTLDSLHADARLAMTQYGRGLDADTVALAQAAALDMEEGSRYTGTGEGVSAADVAYSATAHALTGTTGEYLETFYHLAASTNLVRDSARIRATYDNDYGLYGATQYAADMRAMAEGGYFPSGEMAQYVVAYLDAGGDPYELGIAPEDMNFVRRSAVAMKQTAQDYRSWAQESLTQGQGLAFDVLSNSESNLYRQVVAAAVSRTGGAFVGSMIGYGAGGTYNEAFRQSIQESAEQIRETGVVPGTNGLAWANVDGMAQAAAMAVANMDTLSRWTGNALSLFGVSSAARNGLTQAGESGVMRLLSGAAKLVRGVVRQELDEVILDELREGWLAEGASGFTDTWRQAVESGTASPTTALYAVVQGVGQMITNAGEVVRETAQAAPMGFLYMLPLSVLGAAGELRADMPQTVRAAQTAAKTGRAEDVAAVVTAMREELETATPEQQERVNAAFESQMVTEEAAGVLLGDEDIAQTNVLAAKADEQIASHKENLAASRESWQAGYDAALDAQERMNAGEVDPTLVPQLVAGLEGMDKAETGMAELEREIAQKTQESNRLHAQALSEAVSRARKTVAQRRESRSLEGQAKSIQTRIDQIAAQLTAMAEEEDFDMATAEALATEMGELENALEDVQSAGYARAMQGEEKGAEKDALAPVFRALYSTPLYVTGSQKADILTRTGLKTLSQVNRRYDLKLTDVRDAARSHLDGSFFAELAQMAPGQIDAGTLHPQDALLDLMDRKKALAGTQASLGETGESYLPEGVHYGTQDPVVAQLASLFYQKTGLELVTAPLADGVRALYDRRNGRIILSNRLSAGEMMRVAVMHEATHFIEESEGYEAYRKAALDAAYMGDEDAMKRDMDDVIRTYSRAGVILDSEGVQSELTAIATEKLIESADTDGMLVRALLGEKPGFVRRVYLKLAQFLARRKAKKAGQDAIMRYDAIENAKKRLKEALDSAGKWQAGEGGDIDPTLTLDEDRRNRGEIAQDGEQTEMQFALDRDAQGQLFVRIDEDILDGLPQKEWAKTVKQELRRKFPDGIRVGSNQIRITGKSRGELTESKYTRWLKNNDSQAYSDKLRAAENADEVLIASRDYVNEGLNHERNDHITDFARGVVSLNIGGRDYEASVLVGTKDDGELILYDLIDLTKTSIKKRKQRTAGHQSAPHDRSAASLDTSLSNDEPDVNTQSMQNDAQYALGIRQFGENTAQRSDYMSDLTKAHVRGSEYEKETNGDQLERAQERLQRDGLGAVADTLMSRPEGSFTAEENVLTFAAIAQAETDGDATTAAMLADRMNREATVQGKALQSIRVSAKMTPGGAMAEAIRGAKNHNRRKKNLKGDFIPTGNQPPIKDVSGAPEAVREVRERAQTITDELDALERNVSWDNPWGLPLEDWKMKLIEKYRLKGEQLAGADYPMATRKQRMLMAIIATQNETRGDGLLTLTQQLEFMKDGYAVVTEADLHYIAGQMSEVLAQGGGEGAEMTQAGREALSRVYAAQANTRNASAYEMFRSATFTNMLSSPATWARNIASNVIFNPLEQVSTGIASAVDKAVEKKTGTRTTGLASREEKKAAGKVFREEIVRTFEDAFIRHTDTSSRRKYDLGSGGGRTFDTGIKPLDGYLEASKTVVDFAMQVGDRPFYERCYAQELAVIQRLGVKTEHTKTENGREVTVMETMTGEEMREEATMRALERVFQEDSRLINALNQFKRDNPGWAVALEMIIPFARTPTNIGRRLLNYSPVGLATAILKDGLWDMTHHGGVNFDQRKFVMNIGRGMTGTMMTAAGALLAAAGVIRFGYSDEEDDRRRNVKAALLEPYDMYIQIGDTKHEINFALPGAGGLVIGARLYEALTEATNAGDALNAFTVGIASSTWDELFNSTMLSAFNDVFKGYDGSTGIASRFLTTAGESAVSRLTPSWIRALAKYSDPYARDTYSQNPVMQAINQNLIQSWPIARQLLLPRRYDLTGDAMRQSGYYNQPETESAMLHFMDSFFTPTATIGEKNDEALMELLDLSYRAEKAGIDSPTSCLPAALISANKYELSITKTMAGQLGKGEEGYTISLTDEEKQEINRMYGDLLFNGDGGRPFARYDSQSKRMKVYPFSGLRAMIESAAWENATDAERVEMASEAISVCTDLIKAYAAMAYAAEND